MRKQKGKIERQDRKRRLKEKTERENRKKIERENKKRKQKEQRIWIMKMKPVVDKEDNNQKHFRKEVHAQKKATPAYHQKE